MYVYIYFSSCLPIGEVDRTRFKLTPLSRSDLQEIHDFIADSTPAKPIEEVA